MPRTVAFLLVVALACFVAHGDDEEVPVPREVTIDAAFRYNNSDVFLISGNQYMAIAPDGFERYVLERAGDTQVPVTERIQAAVHWPDRPVVYFFAQNRSYRANQKRMNSVRKGYGSHRRFLRGGGPDAAAFKSGAFYIFRGCEYVSMRGTMTRLGVPQNVSEMNLPCDIDAAWSDEDRRGMTILKGDQMWKWRGENVTGPVPFDSEYHIWSWQLKPTPEHILLS